MAGHSHAHNIKHKKNASDAKRAKIFTKLCREITTAAKQFGPDSARLKVVLEQARKMNLPKDNIDRALKKALDPNNSDNMEDKVYEGFIFDGIAVIIEACTDNPNRTAGKIKEVLRKSGGDLGSCSYLFERKGVIYYPLDEHKDEIFEKALESGATDIQETDEHICIECQPEDFYKIQENCNYPSEESSVIYQAFEEITPSQEQLQKYQKMLDMFENLDDVEEIHSNLKTDLPQE